MKILIVDNGSRYLKQLIRLTSRLHPKIKSYRDLDPAGETDYDLIILSGGHDFPVLGNEKLLSREIDLIKNTKTPILGICFGFELIAHVYGAKLTKLSAKEHDILTITPAVSDPLFAGLEQLEVYESHRWVVKDVGTSLHALAHSKDGIEIIKHKHKPIYGFQFHPEMFKAQTQGDELFANFMKIVENKLVC